MIHLSGSRLVAVLQHAGRALTQARLTSSVQLVGQLARGPALPFDDADRVKILRAGLASANQALPPGSQCPKGVVTVPQA